MELSTYLCNELESYLEKHGVKHEMTVAYTPEQNGVAERRNRTLVEMARCTIAAKILWSSM
jgi:transposase InsO family protein